MDRERPSWLVPMQYTDEPPISAPVAATDEAPLDYSKGPDRDAVFGDDDDDYDPDAHNHPDED